MSLPKICTCPTVPAEDCPFHHKASEAAFQQDWDSRTISIARYYGHGNSTELAEDGRIRPALVLEKAIAVAIDAWADGTAVTIQLCPEEVEQWVALVCVHGHDVTAFSLDETGPLEDRQVQEVWLSSSVLTALDQARQKPLSEIPAEPSIEDAAPDLYAALQRLLRAIEADYELAPTMDVATAFETNSQAIQQARAAIATALGQH